MHGEITKRADYYDTTDLYLYENEMKEYRQNSIHKDIAMNIEIQ